MDIQHAPRASTESRERHSSACVPGRWLVLARGIWITLVVLTLTIFFASLPVYIAQLHTPCAGSTCGFQQLTPEQVGALTGMGLSLSVYVAFTVALALASVVVCLVVSTLIVWRRSDDRMALLVALTLVTFGPIFATHSVSSSPSPWQVPNECLTLLALGLLVLVFLLFPSGQFVPHWMRWTSVVLLAGLVSVVFVAPLKPNTPIDQLGFLVVLGEVAALALVQVYRYRRVSNPLERQQTKWVVFGLAGPATVFVGVGVVAFIFVVLAGLSTLYPLALNVVSPCLLLLIPLSFGFVMLRSHLWDIDVIIRRTLIYSALTLIMTGVYVGLVIGLSALLRRLISQDTNVAIVLSTLAIYILFQPLHRVLQALIDWRFYRRKYDAARTLTAFSATLRNEMDLDQLREQVLAVVQETMQPAYVSLWLYTSELAGKYQALPAYTPRPTGDDHAL